MENTIQGKFADLKYSKGFGNIHQSEARPDSLPPTQNSPQKLKSGLFPEQMNGSAFTVKRAQNQKAWLYKLRPSAIEGQYEKSKANTTIIASYVKDDNLQVTPNQLRWRPIPDVKAGEKKNFVEGLVSILGAGDPSMKEGISIYMYSANESMGKKAFYSSDGDFLIVPHLGTLYITTLHGKLVVKPREICTIQRGIKFTIDVDGPVKGWIAENFRGHLDIPELGPIGCNGMANPKDFCYPQAWYEDAKEEWTLYNKYIGELYQAKTEYSPYDVVAWRGNYSPYKYNLDLYNTMGSVSFDHPDPSIFTVLTCGSGQEGTASLDFVIFPPRWLVQEHTFKPPYYHRNCMSEFMGNIQGHYDAKGVGFEPGCSSLHSTMTPHGPDTDTYVKVSNDLWKGTNCKDEPYKIADTNLAFMFESCFMLKTTKFAFEWGVVEKDYFECWQGLKTVQSNAEPASKE